MPGVAHHTTLYVDDVASQFVVAQRHAQRLRLFIMHTKYQRTSLLVLADHSLAG